MTSGGNWQPWALTRVAVVCYWWYVLHAFNTFNNKIIAMVHHSYIGRWSGKLLTPAFLSFPNSHTCGTKASAEWLVRDYVGFSFFPILTCGQELGFKPLTSGFLDGMLSFLIPTEGALLQTACDPRTPEEYNRVWCHPNLFSVGPWFFFIFYFIFFSKQTLTKEHMIIDK